MSRWKWIAGRRAWGILVCLAVAAILTGTLSRWLHAEAPEEGLAQPTPNSNLAMGLARLSMEAFPARDPDGHGPDVGSHEWRVGSEQVTARRAMAIETGIELMVPVSIAMGVTLWGLILIKREREGLMKA